MQHDVTAPKIIAVHLSYRSRAEQRGRVPSHPSYFFKPASSLAATGSTIERPLGTELLAFEGEIALIIGRDIRRVSPDEAWAAVSGVTAANDFGLYDFRAADKGSNVRSKGGDGYTPLGPDTIPADRIDPSALRIRTWVNGELAQNDTTEDLLFSFGQIIADLSQMMTLHTGDIILTGTPAGSSVVAPGDTVEVEVDAPNAEGSPTTGRLTTTVIEGSTPFSEVGAKPKATDAQREAAWGSREAAGLTPVLTDELREKLGSVGTATLSSQLRKRGLNNVSIDGVSGANPGTRLVGRARTLRYIPNREDLFSSHGGGYNAQKRIVDSLEAGDVLVMEARGDSTTGTLGDVIALRAQQLGAAGVVTDGGVRDIAEVRRIGLPTFHNGAHPAVLGRKHVPWDTDVTIACGGASVQPGDIVVGDEDGVIVIPPAFAVEVADAAIEQEKQEEFIAEMVSSGERIEGLFPMNDDWKERYRAWLSQQ
ncbi:fumarylacetoacetate hydrolase family protein [Paramicrobacterium sp. CJ85]|uniref:fumarylacetoacetate hydrolase family protein n=1 Tax=Paramicrobacterium sp. CJ85 TaxID=3445355 RepID=UPI003F620E85